MLILRQYLLDCEVRNFDACLGIIQIQGEAQSPSCKGHFLGPGIIINRVICVYDESVVIVGGPLSADKFQGYFIPVVVKNEQIEIGSPVNGFLGEF